MQAPTTAFKPRCAVDWSKDRIELLSTPEIVQLRLNAEKLRATDIAALCEEVLHARPKSGGKSGAKLSSRAANSRRLVSRGTAFESRGVSLRDPRTSWSGVRKSDGMVVMNLWADSIQSKDGRCSCLLWAPNVDGSRPWSDQPAGKERREDCRLALERGVAEGLLVYGKHLEGRLPEDKALTVLGVDPATVLHFQVEQRGKEFWATWGKNTI